MGVIGLKLTTGLFLYQTNRHVLPEVYRQLNGWKQKALMIPDEELRKQALASMRDKAFHCEGGAIYVTAAFSQRSVLVPLIVAFQTISDYLDNLCDRSTSLDADDFRCLHESMLDAVSLKRPLHDYYKFRRENGEPFQDGGYLQDLVSACRTQIALLPGYQAVENLISEWVGLYCDLQVYKHIRPNQRETRLIGWWEDYQSLYPELRWNEFAAAAGSTLGVFALFVAATQPSVPQSDMELYKQAYFPWISAAHILLDYLIDLEEDRIGGDLNFIAYYQDPHDSLKRLQWVMQRAREAAGRLANVSPIHLIAVDGLLGLYLSDGKVSRQPDVKHVAKSLLHRASIRSKLFYFYSKWHRGGKLQVQPPKSN